MATISLDLDLGILALFCWSARLNYAVIPIQLKAPRREHLLLLVAMGISWLPLFWFKFYFRNLSTTNDGGLTHSAGFIDLVLHTSVAAELSHAFPPQMPFMAGVPLNYHYGMDLVAAVLNRFGGAAIPDLVIRFCPILFLSFGVLSVFCVARRFMGSGEAGAAAAVLTILGEDFSFIPGLLQLSTSIWTVQYFQAPSVFSLYFVNPMLPALGMLFTAALCFQHSASARGAYGWITAAALCSVALFETKIFPFVQLCLALGYVFVAGIVVSRRPVYLKEIIAIEIIALPLVVIKVVENKGHFAWTWSPGLEGYVKPAFAAAGWPIFVYLPLLGLICYLVLTFGFRIVGSRALLDSLRLSKERPFDMLLAAFVVLGVILTLCSSITSIDRPLSYNNAIWFLIGSKYVATIFATAVLLTWWRNFNSRYRAFLVLLVGVGAFTSTIEFIGRLGFPQDKFSASTIQVVGFLNRAAKPGAVVASEINEPILILTKLRVLYFDVGEFGDGAIIKAREQHLEEFWSLWRRGIIGEKFIADYNIEWIVAKYPLSENASEARSLRIEPVFANESFFVYNVRRVF